MRCAMRRGSARAEPALRTAQEGVEYASRGIMALHANALMVHVLSQQRYFCVLCNGIIYIVSAAREDPQQG